MGGQMWGGGGVRMGGRVSWTAVYGMIDKHCTLKFTDFKDGSLIKFTFFVFA